MSAERADLGAKASPFLVSSSEQLQKVLVVARFVEYILEKDAAAPPTRLTSTDT